MADIRPAFTDEEEKLVQEELELLASKLARIEGSNVEEYHWANIYRAVKGLDPGTWSNLPFQDYLHDGIGVEWKLLKRPDPASEQGGRLMHPAATRQVSFDTSAGADEAKDRILTQWGASIDAFREQVRRTNPAAEPDLRWGVLLWKPDYREYLYFEEEVQKPDPSAYEARWRDGRSRGKDTRNLWVYEKATGIKRFSVTSPKHGAKIQPYFDIPTVDEGAYLFRVPNDAIRLPAWISRRLYEKLGFQDVSPAMHDEKLKEFLGGDYT